MLTDEFLDPLGEDVINDWLPLRGAPTLAHDRAGDGEETADAAFGSLGNRGPHSSDVSRSNKRRARPPS